MEADVQSFLEHSGVKGMKWGVRKTGTAKEQRAKNREFNKSNRPPPRTKEERKKTIANVAKIAIGAAFIANALRRDTGPRNVNKLPTFPLKNQHTKLVKQHNVKMDRLLKDVLKS